jgi:hypothetical protein
MTFVQSRLPGFHGLPVPRFLASASVFPGWTGRLDIWMAFLHHPDYAMIDDPINRLGFLSLCLLFFVCVSRFRATGPGIRHSRRLLWASLCWYCLMSFLSDLFDDERGMMRLVFLWVATERVIQPLHLCTTFSDFGILRVIGLFVSSE